MSENKIEYLNVGDYSISDMVHNLREWMNCATETQFNDGKDWYHKAYREGEKLSKHSGLSVKSCVGILAVLAPYNKWEQNVLDAWAIVNEMMIDGCADNVKVCTYKDNRNKAWRIACGEDADYVVKGDKITSFYLNILRAGDGTLDDDTTVDMWAARAACAQFNANKLNLSSSKYDEVRKAYQTVAKEHKLAPKQLQAIIWVTIRDLSKGIRQELETMNPMFCPNCLGMRHNFIRH